jgi:tyrosinase
MGTSAILRRPAIPPPARIRRDLVKLVAANDPTVDLYRRAIGVMKTRPLRDPTSWRYQAAIHDYPFNDGGTPATPAARAAATQARKNDPRNPDPFATDDDYTAVGGPLPPDRGTFWRKCQHGSWFFLSWHRMYLHFFEQIIINIVTTQLGGHRTGRSRTGTTVLRRQQPLYQCLSGLKRCRTVHRTICLRRAF